MTPRSSNRDIQRYRDKVKENTALRLKVVELVDQRDKQILGAYAEAHDNIKQWLSSTLAECRLLYSFPDDAIQFASEIEKALDDTAT